MNDSLPHSLLICLLTLLISAGGAFAQEVEEEPLPTGVIGRLGSPDSAWSGVYVLRFSPDGKVLASRSLDDRIRFWSIDEGKVAATVPQQEDRIKSMEFTRDSKSLVTTDGFNPGRIWNVADGSLRETLKYGGKIVRVLPGDKLGLADQAKYLEQRDDGEFSETRIGSTSEPVALSLLGSHLATFRPSSKPTTSVPLFLWDVQAVKQVAQLPGLQSPPIAADFSPQATYLAAAGRYENHVMLWELGKNKAHQLNGHEKKVLAIHFSPSGRFLATAGMDKAICVWETATGKKLATLKGHQGNVCSLAFSRDERRLATGASGRQDNSILIWDVAKFTTPGEVPPVRPAGDDLVAIWDRLSDEDPESAYATVGVLVKYPEATFELLREQLSPHLRPAKQGQIEDLILALDADSFVERTEAEEELIRLRVMADTLLNQTLAATTSPEVRYRITRILNAESDVNSIPRSEKLRMSRVVHALSLIAGDEAKKLLQDISTGHEALEVMRDAVGVLERRD